MRKQAFLLLVIVILACGIAPFLAKAAETQVRTDWFDSKDSKTADGLDYVVLFSSGEPAYAQVKIQNDTKIIISFGDCKYYEDYKFCFSDRRFDLDEGYGSIDYAKDKEYHQVQITVYKKEVDLDDLTITRIISAEEVIVGDPIDVTVTLSNSNLEPFFGVSYIEEIPEGILISNFLGADKYGNTLRWQGNLDKNGRAVFTYRIIPEDAQTFDITGTLKYSIKNITNKDSVTARDAEEIISVTPSWTEKE